MVFNLDLSSTLYACVNVNLPAPPTKELSALITSFYVFTKFITWLSLGREGDIADG
jgi:xanthosine utilization system XapX-like protein